MKRSISCLFAFLTLVSASAFAAAPQNLSIQELVDQYYAQKEVSSQKHLQLRTESKSLGFKAFEVRPQRRGPRDCQPDDSGNCTDVVCDKLGTFGCNEMSEINEVNRICRGNYGGDCINAACNALGTFGCNEMSEVSTVGRACVGNYDTGCFTSTCSRLGTFGCNEMSEVEQVLRSCAGN